MSKKSQDNNEIDISKSSNLGKAGRAALNTAGSIPFVGGLLSAAAGAWSEAEQEQVNKVFQNWLQMLKEEVQEQAETIIEIMARVDMQDEKIKERITSKEYQSLLKKSFRNWSRIETEQKRIYMRNLLSNAAVSDLTSDDVIRLFVDWLLTYSPFHLAVIGAIYNDVGITRLGIWNKLGRREVREDSADADLYRRLIRDLSTDGVIRQHRETDAFGNFIKRRPVKRGVGGSTMKSAFDDEEPYELTELGQQFIHYAMNELTARIEFNPASYEDASET